MAASVPSGAGFAQLGSPVSGAPAAWCPQRAADRTSHGNSAVSVVPAPGGLTP